MTKRQREYIEILLVNKDLDSTEGREAKTEARNLLNRKDYVNQEETSKMIERLKSFAWSGRNAHRCGLNTRAKRIRDYDNYDYSHPEYEDWFFNDEYGQPF
jgi:hypothetical protein